MSDDASISIQEAWVAAGGHPDIRPSKLDLLIALRQLDQACDEADTTASALKHTQAELASLKQAIAAPPAAPSPEIATAWRNAVAQALVAEPAAQVKIDAKVLAAVHAAIVHQSQQMSDLQTQLMAKSGQAATADPTVRAALVGDKTAPTDASVQEQNDTAIAVGQLIFALSIWKQTTPQSAPRAWASLVDACAGMVAAAACNGAQPLGVTGQQVASAGSAPGHAENTPIQHPGPTMQADGWRIRPLPDDEHPASKRMRERFESKYGALSDVMACANALSARRERFREAFNRHREQPTTEADIEAAERELAAAVQGYARWVASHLGAVP